LEIKRHEEQKEVFKVEIKEYNEKIQSNKSLKVTNENVLDTLRRKIANLRYQLKEADDIKIPEPVDLAVFEEEINKLSSEIDEIKNTVQTILDNNEETTNEYQKASENRNKIDAEWQKHNDFVDKIRSTHSKHDEDKSVANEALVHYKNLLNNVIAQITEKENEIKFYEDDLKRYSDAALELSTRIETKRPAKAIETEVQKIEIQIKLTEKQ
jgi:chromosome segregation ATPase